MRLVIHLLGQPRIDHEGTDAYVVRSRKSWALLAYLLLAERPPSRARLASLLFAETEDPLRALRWNLSELRRALGPAVDLAGDPVVLRLPPNATVDVSVVQHGSWEDALDLYGFGAGLLEAFTVRDGAAFDSWLLAEQRHIAAATEAIMHEAALSMLSRDRIEDAIEQAVRLVAVSPLDENHHALLIRLYRLAGDTEAAERQHALTVTQLRDELGIEPGAVIEAALREPRRRATPVADDASIYAILEVGTAAVAAGALGAGVESLRAAVRMADSGAPAGLRLESRLVLAEALIHSLGGLDEEGLASLHEAHEIALAEGDVSLVGTARTELGYVDFLRGRYDRSDHWLTQALDVAADDQAIRTKALMYLGSVESDRADYPRAVSLLTEADELAVANCEPRRSAYAASMLGRIHLLRGDLDAAADHLDRSIRLANTDHWLAFVAWPQALLGEVQLASGQGREATKTFEQAFARACQLGDPCWEGISARGLALATAAGGDVTGAFAGLLDARARGRRLADPYIWLDAYILDALCALGVTHRHPKTAVWADEMNRLAARCGMRELHVRALGHQAALGLAGAGASAALLAADIDNPALGALRERGPQRTYAGS